MHIFWNSAFSALCMPLLPHFPSKTPPYSLLLKSIYIVIYTHPTHYPPKASQVLCTIMEFIVTTTLSIVISLLLSLQTSDALQNVEPLSLDEQAAYTQHPFPLPKLPRKLLHEEVLTDQKYGFQDTILDKKQKKDISGKHIPAGEQKAMMHGSKGTWKEWMEGSTDASHFFTMDYTHVKRRRPIHNKSLPVSP